MIAKSSVALVVWLTIVVPAAGPACAHLLEIRAGRNLRGSLWRRNLDSTRVAA
jgi:hypothetical protein